MNIVEIIKKAPKDHRYWSLVFGECEVDIIKDDIFPIYAHSADKVHRLYLTERGTNTPTMDECLLFPSRDNRDWEAFERELDGVKDNDIRLNPLVYGIVYGTNDYKDGVFSGYCKMGDMIEINLDHEYYKEFPYIDFQIDGEKHRVSTEEIKRLVMGNADNKTEHVSGQSFNGTPKIVWDDNTKKIIKMAEKWQREIEKIEKHWKEVGPMTREIAQRVNEMYEEYKEYQRRNNHDKKTD